MAADTDFDIKKCTHCNGTGQVACDADHIDHDEECVEDCGYCDGYGQIARVA